MATATFAERIQDDLALLIADATMIDLSRQRDATGTELATRTIRVAQMAAAKVEGVLGSVGSYDDTDGTIGDQAALDLGIRIAIHYYSNVYTLVGTDSSVANLEALLEELNTLANGRRQSNSTPVVSVADNDELNTRHDVSVWDDDDDTDS